MKNKEIIFEKTTSGEIIKWIKWFLITAVILVGVKQLPFKYFMFLILSCLLLFFSNVHSDCLVRFKVFLERFFLSVWIALIGLLFSITIGNISDTISLIYVFISVIIFCNVGQASYYVFKLRRYI